MSRGKGKQREDLKQEDVSQAVVIADSFNVRFGPITDRKPRTLLPVANVAMLDYTLESLTSAGIQEIFVFCCHHADKIKEHISNSKFSSLTSSTVSTIVSDGCMSMGDALREIHDKSIIRSDFILIYGDVVTNANLSSLLEEHKKSKQTRGNNAVMTMVYKSCPPRHRTRCQEDDVVMALETSTNRVLHYQKVADHRKFVLPKEVLSSNNEVTLRYDLLNCQINICSPQVPSLFKDNFDYLTRDDFVRGILENEEIMGYTMYIKVIQDQYAARISNLHMYDAVSRDILSRWSYPIVPDNSFIEERSSVTYGRHNVYLSNDVTLARGCELEKSVYVGRGTSVGSNTVITNSVIGKDCRIGENVKIDGAYIWDNVTIENSCRVESSILCNGVVLYDSSHVSQGCILSWDVKVGPSITIPRGTRLKSSPDDEEDDFGEDLPEADQATKENAHHFGSRSQAYLFRLTQDPTDSDEEEEDQLIHDMFGLEIQSESESDTETDLDESSEDNIMGDDMDVFYTEAIDTLKKYKNLKIDGTSTENLKFEINSLKHSYNINIRDLYGLITKAIIDLPMREDANLDGNQLLSSMKQNLTKYQALIKNYVRSGESQMDCLHSLEDFCQTNEKVQSLFMKLLHHLYDLDILSEQAVIKWHGLPPMGDNTELHVSIRKQVAPLIKWLQEAEEESSEEDSD
ncbi:hypothetical protein FSP39_000456 [Pinctada imbricata]|uniref:Translation initiation factor eIF2B subunit epsilon n=1 Tax=Pinctada imbricata TaxID=66713 RepID=A0AA89BWL3_PINIB|nr:hypothetical protein FSP39_000456 [Pinctada imbricata]